MPISEERLFHFFQFERLDDGNDEFS